VVVHAVQVFDVVSTGNIVPPVVGIPAQNVNPQIALACKVENDRKPFDGNFSDVGTPQIFPGEL
jgi:hypothetical protein